MPFLDAPDTVVAQLTAEARAILARVKTGDVVYRHLGWQLGRGGYQDEFTSSTPAAQTLTVVDFPVQGDTVSIGGAVLTAYLTGANGTTQFEIGATLEDIAENIKTAINVNSTLAQFFIAKREGVEITVECRVSGGIGNFIAVSSSGTWLELGGQRLSGGIGLSGSNPVKVTQFTDNATEAKAIVKVVGLDFEAGDAIVINGVFFAVDYQWVAAVTKEVTAQNIVDAIRDSKDSRIHRIVTADLDADDPTKIIISTYITGAIGNALPIYVWDLEPPASTTPNLLLEQAASNGLSTFLQDPAYPVPPSLASFELPEGKIEKPTANSVSFVCRVGDGNIGINGYGELGIWAEVVESNFKPEIGDFLVLEILKNDLNVIQFHVHSHGLVENQTISFSTTDRLPAAIEAQRTYYVKNPTLDLFEIALTPSDDSLTTTDSIDNEGVHTVHTGVKRKFLFAHAHFPLQSKNDRMLLTYRIIVNF